MNENLNSDERREWARTLYINQGYSISKAASTVNVDNATMEQWVNEGAWEGLRQTLAVSKNKQLKIMYALVNDLNTKVNANLTAIDSKEVDLIVKYTRAIKNLETKITLSQRIEVFEEFMLWLKKKDSALVRTISPRFDEFIKLHIR